MSSFEPWAAAGSAGSGLEPIAAPSVDASPLSDATQAAKSVLMPLDQASVAPSEDELRQEALEAERHAMREAATEAGRERGRAEYEAEIGLCCEDLKTVVVELQSFRAGLVERYERELLAIALQVAETILGEALAEQPERWLKLVSSRVEEALERESIRIQCGSAVYGVLESHREELCQAIPGVGAVELDRDPTLGPTECRVLGSHGELDLGVAAQVDTVRDQLMGSR